MKYVVDIDALISCIDCVHSIRTNGDDYISITMIKEFISKFPKDKVECTNVKCSIALSEPEATQMD